MESKGTSSKEKYYEMRDSSWQTYEALLSNVHFEWPCPIQQTAVDAQAECTEYLDKILDGRYNMHKFYLKRGAG